MFGNIFGLIALACMVLVIYDVAANQKKMDTTQKVLWIIASVVFSIVTAIVYYFVVYSKKKK